MNLKPYRKALTGGATAGLTALAAAYADGVVTGGEWVGVVVATLLGLGLVFAVPNSPSVSPVEPAK